jgi:nucleotide-binding universal stress UspA family protein
MRRRRANREGVNVMADLNKIMVAVAFGQYTEGIFRYAVRLANRMNADLVVASIINQRDVSAVRRIVDMGYEVDGDHYVSDIKKEREEILAKLISDCGFPADRVKTVIQVGNPVDQLLKILVSEDVDMVLMGVKGRSDLEHVFIGSVADKLFRRSPVTVVSYRDDSVAERLKKRIPANA